MAEDPNDLDRLRAFVEHLLPECKGNEARTYMFMLSRSFKSGRVTIGNPVIAKALATDERSASVAVRGLMHKGALRRIKAGGGRHNVPTYDLPVVEGPSQTPLFDPAHEPDTHTNPGQITRGNSNGVSKNPGYFAPETPGKNAQNPGEFCTKPRAKCPPDINTKTKTPTTPPPCPPRAVVAAGFSEEVHSFLRNSCGVNEPKATEMASRHPLAKVREAHRDYVNMPEAAKKKIANKAGFIIRRLEPRKP